MGQSTDYLQIQDRIFQFGEWAFVDSTSSVAVEVPTKLGTITSAFATPEAYAEAAGNGKNVMFCDKTITSGQVTMESQAWGSTNLKFSYLFIGTMGATPGTVSSA